MVELRFIVAGQVVLCQIGVIYCPIRGIVNDRVQDPISKGPGLSVGCCLKVNQRRWLVDPDKYQMLSSSLFAVSCPFWSRPRSVGRVILHSTCDGNTCPVVVVLPVNEWPPFKAGWGMWSPSTLMMMLMKWGVMRCGWLWQLLMLQALTSINFSWKTAPDSFGRYSPGMKLSLS